MNPITSGPDRFLLVACIVMMSACSTDTDTDIVEAGVSRQLAQQRASTISRVNYELYLVIPKSKDAKIAGEISISFLLANKDQALQLDFRESGDNIHTVAVNGRESTYRFINEHIVVPREELLVGNNVIDIEFTAGDSSLNRNPDYLYTLFVPDRARTAFPLFDQPDIKATYELSLRVPQSWQVMSNAALASVRASDGNSEFEFARSDLISSYLFSFVAGAFELVEREIGGRKISMLHRETDARNVARNIDDLFSLHIAALDWMETYTGVKYPFQKFAFVLIPAFQYGGMEHVGAIQYRAASLFLDESPSQQDLLRRAGLIAHETAHMWFGNLVTMEWFNDVWTKEVFANFMAAKIVNPAFPQIDHDLNFLRGHYPRAYSVDRTEGANPIRQDLGNLNEAGQLYGAIIYNKAPIMMRQLETIIGEDLFRDGMREYLREFSFSNATWPALIDILDARSEQNLHAWSEVWVNTAGRPEFEEQWETTETGLGRHFLLQHDTASSEHERVWPQQFGIVAIGAADARQFSVASVAGETTLGNMRQAPDDVLIFNADGKGYGLFPASLSNLDAWDRLQDVQKGAELINLYEVLLSGSGPDPLAYLESLRSIAASEQNVLIIDLVLDQLQSVWWRLLTIEERDAQAPGLEATLWDTMRSQTEASRRKIYFQAFADIALTEHAVNEAYLVWSGEHAELHIAFSENERIDLTQVLAIKMPERAEELLGAQLASTDNPDNTRMLNFIAPSVSPDQAVRDRFFASLAEEENRETESWVLDALENLHHPLRTVHSERYLLPSLELLQEIQITGDIFFPKRWLDATLGNYRSDTALIAVRKFLEDRPDYNAQLRMKILQAADPLFRANAIVALNP